jgi:transcriptional regulator with XRE-family HTH domain
LTAYKKKHSLIYGKLAESSMTQRQLAEKLSIAPATLNAKLKGKAEFKAGEIILICEALNISKEKIISYFF